MVFGFVQLGWFLVNEQVIMTQAICWKTEIQIKPDRQNGIVVTCEIETLNSKCKHEAIASSVKLKCHGRSMRNMQQSNDNIMHVFCCDKTCMIVKHASE